MSTRERVRGGGGGVGIDGGEVGRGGELQPAQPRPAGSAGAAPRHRDAFVRVIILTLTLCWWSCLLFRVARKAAPPFLAGWGGGLGLALVRCQEVPAPPARLDYPPPQRDGVQRTGTTLQDLVTTPVM